MTMGYEKGDMQASRMELALHRWLRNLDKALRHGYVQLPAVLTKSIEETEKHKAPVVSGSIVVPHVDSVRIVTERNSRPTKRPSRDVVSQDGETSRVTVPCHRNESDRSRTLKTRRCDFCFGRYAYRDYRSRFCSGTCKQDAYLVRCGFRNGAAQQYYDSMSSHLVMETVDA